MKLKKDNALEKVKAPQITLKLINDNIVSWSDFDEETTWDYLLMILVARAQGLGIDEDTICKQIKELYAKVH